MNLPQKVKVCECWVRDGIQGQAEFVPTDQKIELINRMIDVGFKRIEATSFAHPKLIPQFADGMDVLKGIRRPDDVCREKGHPFFCYGGGPHCRPRRNEDSILRIHSRCQDLGRHVEPGRVEIGVMPDYEKDGSKGLLW